VRRCRKVRLREDTHAQLSRERRLEDVGDVRDGSVVAIESVSVYSYRLVSQVVADVWKEERTKKNTNKISIHGI
jgi:hypothetical protein